MTKMCVNCNAHVAGQSTFGYCYKCCEDDTIAAIVDKRKEQLDTIQEGVNWLCRYAGDKGVAKDILDAFTRQHRTNQQSIMRLLQCLLRMYSVLDKVRWFDGRNEASREWAEKVAKVDHYLPFV